MIKTIFCILLLIASIVMFILSLISDKDLDKYKKHKFFIGLGLLVVAFLFSTFTIVPSGSSGVRTTFGKVSDTVMESGMNFQLPFIQKTIIINNQVQREDVQGEAASKDLQTVAYNVSVNYNVIASESANLYRNVGKSWSEVIIRPAIQESVKAAIARYTAEQLITDRSNVSNDMLEEISNRMKDYGINVSEINIITMDFSAEFDAAIEAKTVAEQQVLTEQQNLEKAKVIAEQKVVEAQAEAEANRVKNESLTDKIIMNEFLSRWNGELPTVMGSGENIIDISSLLPSAQ